MKITSEDHWELRNITREAITSHLDLMDLGSLLHLPPSIMERKMHDYPRSIETASYMVASEWWDSSDNSSMSRKEKYGKLRDAVHSMGKEYTAKTIDLLILRISTSEVGRYHPLTNSATNEIDNGNTAINSCTRLPNPDANQDGNPEGV